MKKCTQCGEEKDEGAFLYSQYVKKDGMRSRKSECRTCSAKRGKEWNLRNIEKVKAKGRRSAKAFNIKHRFRASLIRSRTVSKMRGYTPCTASEKEISAAFTGYCVICGVEENGKKLHMDHDHETGNFRGWICGGCNRGLGAFRDSLTLLTDAMKYLTDPKGKK